MAGLGIDYEISVLVSNEAFLKKLKTFALTRNHRSTLQLDLHWIFLKAELLSETNS
jgi:hypothetical protein